MLLKETAFSLRKSRFKLCVTWWVCVSLSIIMSYILGLAIVSKYSSIVEANFSKLRYLQNIEMIAIEFSHGTIVPRK